jgi:IS5 family transposase
VQSILQGLDAPLVPNTAVAKVLEAANNAKTAAGQGPKAADSKSGRKLLQRSRSASRNNNWSAQNTQSAIRAAAAGRTPVSYATAAGSRNARNANRGCVNCVNWR